jgi:hypothetical protein
LLGQLFDCLEFLVQILRQYSLGRLDIVLACVADSLNQSSTGVVTVLINDTKTVRPANATESGSPSESGQASPR